jgi:HSP20 family protein
MSNLTRRELDRSLAWDPFRLMEDLFGSQTPRGLAQQRFAEAGWTARFDVKETEGAFVFVADLPGVEEKDLDIQLSGNILTVSGKREAEKRDEQANYYAVERSFGAFSRSFQLPAGIDGDKVEAKLVSGVLTLTIPKSTAAKSKKIDVKKA